MKIQELLEAHYEASAKASDLSRQLSFAGIAVIWILKTGNNSGGIHFSAELLIPLYCFVAGLAIDFLQYIYKAAIWFLLNHYHWRKHKNNDIDVNISQLVNLPTHIMFWGKIATVSYGYFVLLLFMKSKF